MKITYPLTSEQHKVVDEFQRLADEIMSDKLSSMRYYLSAHELKQIDSRLAVLDKLADAGLIKIAPLGDPLT